MLEARPAPGIATAGPVCPQEPGFADLAFVLGQGVPVGALLDAIHTARAVGSTADRVLITGGAISSDRFYRALAAHLGVAYVDGPFTPDLCSPVEAARAGLVRLADDAPWCWLAAPEGARLAALVRQRQAGGIDRLAAPPPLISRPGCCARARAASPKRRRMRWLTSEATPRSGTAPAKDRAGWASSSSARRALRSGWTWRGP